MQAEQHDDNAAHRPLHSLQQQSLSSSSSSLQIVYGITPTDSSNLSSTFPSSCSTSNVSHAAAAAASRSLNDIENDEPCSSSAVSSTVEQQPQSTIIEPQSSPLTENNFHTSVPSKIEISSPHPRKNHHHHHVIVLSSIFDLKRLVKRFNPSIVLQNCGSVARDHLASERTFLAYVHTSLSLSSAGVGVVQLLTIGEFIFPNASDIPMQDAASKKMKKFAMPLGVLTQLLALYILFLGEFRVFFLDSYPSRSILL